MSERLYRIELPWGMEPTVEQVVLIEKLSGKPVRFSGDNPKQLDWGSTDIEATLKEAEPLLPFTIKEGLPYSRHVSDAEAAEAMRLRVDVAAPVNERCNVVVAGNGMLQSVDSVQLLADACTNDLQGHLNNGWRILAICVQPDQRRPDYVLGKIGGAA